jgi:hypothetical protein
MPDDANIGGGVTPDTEKNIITIPKNYNYIGIFLTFACQLKCHYCINHEKGAKPTYAIMTGAEWIAALNKIKTQLDLPITLQGGEPTMHPDFYEIVNGIKPEINIDLLTNAQFDMNEFTRRVPPSRIMRNAKYASIRVSYHPRTMSIEDTVDRVCRLRDDGYSVGVWIVDYPKDPLIHYYWGRFVREGVDVRLKQYLDGDKNGTYKYMDMQGHKDVLCRPSELLVAPNGDIFRCHGDLYNNRKPYANIRDKNIKLIDDFVPCEKVQCNSCDIKVKFDRHQVTGHCAVEIKEYE